MTVPRNIRLSNSKQEDAAIQSSNWWLLIYLHVRRSISTFENDEHLQASKGRKEHSDERYAESEANHGMDTAWEISSPGSDLSSGLPTQQ